MTVAPATRRGGGLTLARSANPVFVRLNAPIRGPFEIDCFDWIVHAVGARRSVLHYTRVGSERAAGAAGLISCQWRQWQV
jgi:hypothetical protein